MEQYDAPRTLNQLGTYQTNKDQVIGRIIAEVASLIAKEKGKQTDMSDTTDNGVARWTQQAQGEAERP
jgi:hypothetical protein